MTWDAKTSWNVCKTRTCRGPVEGPGGSVEFFDGSEAHCIECGREYMVAVGGGEDSTPWLVNVYPTRARKVVARSSQPLRPATEQTTERKADE